MTHKNAFSGLEYGLFAIVVAISSGCSVQPYAGQFASSSFVLDAGVAGSGGAVSILDSSARIEVSGRKDDSGGPTLVVDGGQDGSCAATGFEAVPVEVEKQVEVEVNVPQPVALYIMLDQSLTMNETTGTGIALVAPSKWGLASNAINAFVKDPASKDLDVAIQYFPLGESLLTDLFSDTGAVSDVFPECQGTAYRTPDVSMGRLPAQAQAIVDSLTLHGPAGIGTPIEAALRGAIDYCKQFTSSNPGGEECVVVLITDGLPNGCNLDYAALAGVAGNGFKSAPNIKTFAIGMTGADFSLLNQIGQQGGTDCTPNDAKTYACDVAAGMTLLEAFELIRKYVVETHLETRKETQYVKMECQWEIPPPPANESFDREKVNVEFTPTGLEADKTYLGKVDSLQACGSQLGWYYDDPKAPKQIVACPEACTAIKNADLGKIRVLLGCQTVTVR
jgi:hypothetical protein